ncbi:MAG: acyl carrier protein [Nodularia sp. (in: Bacteria)]|nr:MAG: acyl carrier protein [Nodularia sp. (in: cyanobacteria)]
MKDKQAKIKNFISQFFVNYEVQEEEDIFALGFVNSMFAMQLVLFIEQEFKITIVNEDLELNNFRTIKAITALLEKKMAMSIHN